MPASVNGPLVSPPNQFAQARDGVRISYVVYEGAEPVFLIVNTPGAPANDFKTTSPLYAGSGSADAFRRGRALVYFDWRGSGLSGPVGSTHGVDELAADLEAITAQLGAPVDARAFGMACFPLFLHAARQPERYRSIQIDGGMLRADEGRQGFHFRPGGESRHLARVEGILSAYWGVDPTDVHRQALRIVKGVPARVFELYQSSWCDVDLTNVLPRVTVPTWVTARHELDYEPAAALAALLPNSILTIYTSANAGRGVGAEGRHEWDQYLGRLLGDEPARLDRDTPERTVDVGGVKLTPRQRDVLELVAKGERNREIGAQLDIAVGTVKRHVSDLLHKTGLEDRKKLMRWFWDEFEESDGRTS
jgi:DNA-binding CsgD family transcriptional regulator/pimeloyl-ACP methyl ester carboxylesterase